MQLLSIHSIYLDQKYITKILKFNICDYNHTWSDATMIGHNLETEEEFTNCAQLIRYITKTDGQ